MGSFIIAHIFDENTIGVEKAIGRLLNLQYLIPHEESFYNKENTCRLKIWSTNDIRDIPDGPLNGDSIDGVNAIPNGPACDLIHLSDDSGYTDDSSSSFDSSSSSSSVALLDFDDSGPERNVHSLRWTGERKKIVFQMYEFTGLFVFLDEEVIRLLIGPVKKTKRALYQFFVRPFVCLIEIEGRHEQREGVTITYQHSDLSLDVTSRLQHGEKEVAVQDQSPYDIKNPDERFFLKHKDTDGSERYESLNYHNMCFKFENNTQKLAMSKYHEASKSVDFYLFQTYPLRESVPTIMWPEGPVRVPTEDNTKERKTLELEPEVRDSGEELASRTTVIGTVSGITGDENNNTHETGIKLATDSEIGVTPS